MLGQEWWVIQPLAGDLTNLWGGLFLKQGQTHKTKPYCFCHPFQTLIYMYLIIFYLSSKKSFEIFLIQIGQFRS